MASSPDILYADSQDPGIAEVFIDMENVDHEEPVEEITDQSEMVATLVNATILPREDDSSARKASSSGVKIEASPSKSSSSSTPKAVTSSANKTLKPIAPKITSPVSPGSTAKLLVPVQTALRSSRTPLKTVTGSNTSTVTTTATSTPTFLITGSTGTSLIMLQPVLPQQATSTATGSNQSQIQPSIVTPVPTKFSTTPRTATTPIKTVTLINSKQAISTPQKTNFVPIAPNPLTSQSALSASQILAGLSAPRNLQNGPKSDNDPNRPRKPCNCTKSQCLKLYCECFANGEFCNSCNCINCANNLKHEEERQKAIKQCLERNPHAFHPKIGKGRGDMTERRHTKGCNCRRSGCLKNYCECYEAKILCSELCKCISCKNYEDSFERKTLMHLADAAEVRSAQQSVASKSQLCGNDFRPKLPLILADRIDRLHCAFITSDIIDTTCECLLLQAENGIKDGLNPIELENLILDEFGRCLRQIIDIANNSKSAKTGNL